MNRELRSGDVRPEDFDKDGQLTPEAKRRLGLTGDQQQTRGQSNHVARKTDYTALVREAFSEETLRALESLRGNDIAEFITQYNNWKTKLRDAKISLVQWEKSRAKVARDYQREHRAVAPLTIPYNSVCPVILECYLRACLLIDSWDRQLAFEPLVPFMAHTRETEATIDRAVYLSEQLIKLAFNTMISHRLIDKRDSRLVSPSNSQERRSLHRWLQGFERHVDTNIVSYAADVSLDVIAVCEKKAEERRTVHIARLFVDGIADYYASEWCSDVGTEVFGDALRGLLSIQKRSKAAVSR